MLSKREKEKMRIQMEAGYEKPRRIWTQRPVVFLSKKHDKKKDRREAKAICREYY